MSARSIEDIRNSIQSFRTDDFMNGDFMSVWEIQGAVTHSAVSGDFYAPAFENYAVYLGDLLATFCNGVEVLIEYEDGEVDEVVAQKEGAGAVNLFTWMFKATDDPIGDNVLFKFAWALDSFGRNDLAAELSATIDDEELREHLNETRVAYENGSA